MAKTFSNIKERILYLSDIKENTKADFFKKTGLRYDNFKGNALKSDIKSASLEKIIAIYPDINAVWLLSGKGEVLKNNTPIAQHTIDNKNVQANNGNIQQVFNNNKGNSYNHNHTATPASTIDGLKTQIKELNNIIKEKDKVIKMLLEQQSTLINKLK